MSDLLIFLLIFGGIEMNVKSVKNNTTMRASGTQGAVYHEDVKAEDTGKAWNPIPQIFPYTFGYFHLSSSFLVLWPAGVGSGTQSTFCLACLKCIWLNEHL